MSESKYLPRLLTVVAHRSTVNESFVNPDGTSVNSHSGDWVIYNPYICVYQVLTDQEFNIMYELAPESKEENNVDPTNTKKA